MRTHSAQIAEWELREAALRTDPDERSKRAFACLLLAHSHVGCQGVNRTSATRSTRMTHRGHYNVTRVGQ
jgi:hypothetical protein